MGRQEDERPVTNSPKAKREEEDDDNKRKDARKEAVIDPALQDDLVGNPYPPQHAHGPYLRRASVSSHEMPRVPTDQYERRRASPPPPIATLGRTPPPYYHPHPYPPPPPHYYDPTHPYAPHQYPPPPPLVLPPPSSHPQLTFTSDASTKLSDRVRRRCFNCCTSDTSTWRRSNLNPGKVLCNKCGLFERTHARPRPEQFPHKRTSGVEPSAGHYHPYAAPYRHRERQQSPVYTQQAPPKKDNI